MLEGKPMKHVCIMHYDSKKVPGSKLESLRRSWKKKEINMFVVKSAEINMFVRLKSVARSYKPTDEQSWWTWRSRRARYFPQNQKLCVSAVSKKKISAGLVTKFKVEKQENGANTAVGRGSWLADWFRGWDDCDKKGGAGNQTCAVRIVHNSYLIWSHCARRWTTAQII